MKHEILTEYFEDAVEELDNKHHSRDLQFDMPKKQMDDGDVVQVMPDDIPDEAFVVSFSEDDSSAEDKIPGAINYVEDEEPEEPTETTWFDDRDVSKFIDFLREAFPGGIPQHDGNSISGCEKAMAYLNDLNRDISDAVRKDVDGVLDDYLDEIEDYRVKILKGMVKLKHRMGELKKKIREEASQEKKAVEDDESIKKNASREIQMIMTPFERAIAGILINSTVSAGNPFETVYDYLKEKFELTPREELAIIQLVMDMGYPIFKDRGAIGSDKDDEDGHGIDFIKNYFA